MLRQAQREGIWGVHALVPHPAYTRRAIETVTAQILHIERGEIAIEYQVRPATRAIIPDQRDGARADGLWKTTCFEAFFQPGGDQSYFEFNFSPSSDWAAYAFDGYRLGMCEFPVDRPPAISRTAHGDDHFFLAAEFDPPPNIGAASSLGLSAVIEETDGTKSYWALAHPEGPPDFHDPACFVLTLPAANGA